MVNKPLKIGVTGGIGAGKSIVCQLFSILGAPVYNADERAKTLMVQDHQVVDSIKREFGDSAYLIDGSLNRVYLANHVFKNEKRLKLINGIVHPAVANDFDRWSKRYEGLTYIIKEAALLIESNSYKLLDYLITVTSPVDIRIERVLARDHHRTKINIDEIVSNQLSDQEKIAKSRFVITNDGNTLLIPQVLKIHQALISSIQTV
jgi:dephospho-CoA kinase